MRIVNVLLAVLLVITLSGCKFVVGSCKPTTQDYQCPCTKECVKDTQDEYEFILSELVQANVDRLVMTETLFIEGTVHVYDSVLWVDPQLNGVVYSFNESNELKDPLLISKNGMVYFLENVKPADLLPYNQKNVTIEVNVVYDQKYLGVSKWYRPAQFVQVKN